MFSLLVAVVFGLFCAGQVLYFLILFFISMVEQWQDNPNEKRKRKRGEEAD